MEYRISDIIIYPVKGLGGIHLQTGTVEAEGFQYDRRWVLVDANNRFISQREASRMAVVSLKQEADGFCAAYGSSSILIPFEKTTGEEVDVTIWNDTVAASRVSDETDKWFSEVLGMECRLMRHTPRTQRKVNPLYARGEEMTAFTDGFPVLVIGQAALDDLNAKLENPVPMNRFRPNIVFTGGEAFAEDGWGMVQAGNTTFAVVKPCARCVVTTIDQATGIAGHEPLKTLATYRRIDNSVLFGQNMLVMQQGRIQIGDMIVPQEK